MMTIIDLYRNIRERHNKPLKTPLKQMVSDAGFLEDLNGKLGEPTDYEPPFFRSYSDQEAKHPWTNNPPKTDVGNVNNKHLPLALTVKSILEPCDDKSDDLQDDGMVSLGEDSVERDDTDMEVKHSTEEDHFVVAPVGNTNFFSFVISRAGGDTYAIRTREDAELHLQLRNVKEEKDAGETHDVKFIKKTDEYYMYMKALYHALPVDCVTVALLHQKLHGEAKHATVGSLIDRDLMDILRTRIRKTQACCFTREHCTWK